MATVSLSRLADAAARADSYQDAKDMLNKALRLLALCAVEVGDERFIELRGDAEDME